MLERKIVFAAVSFIFLAVSSVSFGAEFSADMVSGYPGNEDTNKIYVQGQSYRMELVEDGRRLWVIVDKDKGWTRLVLPSDKAYTQMDYSNHRTMMNDPFRALEYNMNNFKTREEGTEKIDGRECKKLVISNEDKDMYTAWICPSLGFPVKIVNHLIDGMFVELRNIEEGEVSDDLFTVPSGYARVEKLPPPMPEWGGDVADSPLLKAPFEKELSEEQIVRAKLLPGKRIKVRGKNLTDGRGSMTVVAFKDGRPLKKPVNYGFRRQGQGVRVEPVQTSAEADEIVIRAKKGAIRVTVEEIPLK